jgi:hypothetical protein
MNNSGNDISLCYIVFRTVERSLRAVPGAIAVHLE